MTRIVCVNKFKNTWTRRDQSNCSVIELNQTQSNLIERLGSIGSEIERIRTKKIAGEFFRGKTHIISGILQG